MYKEFLRLQNKRTFEDRKYKSRYGKLEDQPKKNRNRDTDALSFCMKMPSPLERGSL